MFKPISDLQNPPLWITAELLNPVFEDLSRNMGPETFLGMSRVSNTDNLNHAKDARTAIIETVYASSTSTSMSTSTSTSMPKMLAGCGLAGGWLASQ